MKDIFKDFMTGKGKTIKMKIFNLKGNLWTLSFTLLSLVMSFIIMFYLNLFGGESHERIDYIKDFFPYLCVAASLGFGIFFIGVYFDGKKGGLRYLRNWLIIFFVTYLIGFFKNNFFLK